MPFDARSGLTVIGCALLVAVFLAGFPAFGQSRRIPGVDAIAVDATPEQMRSAVSNARVGRVLAPKSWPNGARVAVCISFDVDNETLWRTRPLPVPLSEGEYGAKEAMPRLLALLDREAIPATFYIPAMSAILHPEMIPEILKRKRHEIGVHGWTHEEPSYIGDAAKEEKLLSQAIEYITQQIGRKPAGIRAPSWDFSPYTLELIRKAGFLYDSSMMGMDQPYEPLSAGKPTNLIELPINWIADDYPYYEPEAAGSLPSPDAVFQIYKGEFDGAYADHSLFILTMHPHITGHRSRIVALQRLIEYIKTKPDVWFATLEQVAIHVKNNHAN